MSHPVPASITTKRKKNRRAIPIHWWLIPLIVVVLGTVVGKVVLRRVSPPAEPGLKGYISSVSTVQLEYARFYGKPLTDTRVTDNFQQASELMRQGDLSGSVTLLEGIARVAAVPAVFNNLGVLYIELNDRSRAVNAFREALTRDVEYRAVRENIVRLQGLSADSAEPVTHEIEPNTSFTSANLIALDRPVEAEIAGNISDEDCFKFNAPQAPRDLLAIEISNLSGTLAPGVAVYDENTNLDERGPDQADRGSNLTRYVAPPPNSVNYVRVRGISNTSGRYTLTVRSMKAFDQYEPNDDILSARKIPLHQPIEANIMDAQDTDHYAFVAPRTGKISIDIRNRSATLVPALTTFAPDMRNSGFGPDLRTPGANLHHTITVEAFQMYYIQVWSQGNSSGDYTLTVSEGDTGGVH